MSGFVLHHVPSTRIWRIAIDAPQGLIDVSKGITSYSRACLKLAEYDALYERIAAQHEALLALQSFHSIVQFRMEAIDERVIA